MGANAWATADLNGDGKADLVAAVVPGSVGVLLGNGDGTFQSVVSYPVDVSPSGVTIADMNADGKLDLITANTHNTISVLLGNGDGTFQAALAYTVGPESQSVVAGDFNNDGRTDLAVANFGSNDITVLLGASSGSLRVVSSHAGSFYIGQVGATYSLTVSNPGSGAISGTFTATDVLPSSLTATAIGGSGWTCVLATVTCTEFTSLQAGAQLQPIIVTVNVAVTSPSQVTNLASVSVPGAVSGSGSDVTNIAALSAPAPVSPVNGQAGVSQTPSLNWSAAVGATSYDVYFGTQSTPPLVTNTTATSYAPRTLATGTTYYWRIVSKNSAGTATTSTLNFVTVTEEGVGSEVGIFRAGLWALNYNGDENGSSASNHYYRFGQTGDIIVAGDWNGDGTTKIGIYRNGLWVLNYNGDGNSSSAFNRYFVFGQAGDVPVVGDWNGDGKTKVGIYRNGLWVLNYNGDENGFSASNRYFQFGQTGDIPVLGDWNGDGKTKAGIYRAGLWALNYNGDEDGFSSSNRYYGFGQAGDIPIVGDWNGDGRAKVAIFRNGLWVLNTGGDGNGFSTSNRYSSFGQAGDIPVVGDWNGDGIRKVGIFRSGLWVLNFTGDGNGFSPNNRYFVCWDSRRSAGRGSLVFGALI